MSAAADVLRERLGGAPDVAVVLGSGLGRLARAIRDPVRIPFQDLPGFPAAGVPGHAGEMIAGTLEGRPVLLQAGRYHLYEGHDPPVVVTPVRTLARLGVTTLLLTNAAGGLDPRMTPGSLMVVDDHLNLLWRNPLVGPVADGEIRFPDMSRPYDRALQARFAEAAGELRIPLFRGTYAAVLGPSFETPAEVRMLRRLGADAVGMSTVPEAITARALGMRVAALSVITNLASGLAPEPPSHEEVIEVGRAASERVESLVRGVLRLERGRDPDPSGQGREV